MLTLDHNEELNKEYDDVSCMNRDTGTERTLYRHAVDDPKSESNIKRSAEATRHLQDYMDRIRHSPHKWEDLKHGDMTNTFWGQFGTYIGKHAKNKNVFSIHKKNKNKKTGDARMKKAPNDTGFFLHPSETEDPKELPDLLEYKTCTAYMGNLKIMFMEKFRENKKPLVFQREHCSRILAAILSMKTEYCRKHNIRLVNPKQRAGQ